MSFEMSDEAKTIKVFNLRADTNEFIGSGDAYIPPHTGLPANCTTIAPPCILDSQVAVFDETKQSWSLIEDHRGEMVYSIETGMEIYVSEIGKLPANVVSVAPSGKYDKWDGNKWVKDKNAEKSAEISEADSQKLDLLNTASATISMLQDAVDLEMATDDEQARLVSWKKYRVLLHRIDTSAAPDINWPECP